jgi:hypothetical protein
MRTVPLKCEDEKPAIMHAVKPYVLDVYIKVTVWSLTMSDSTGEVLWRGSQLAWLAVTRIG